MRPSKRTRSKKAKLDEDEPIDDVDFETEDENLEKNKNEHLSKEELCEYWKVQKDFLIEMKKDLKLLGNDVVNSKVNLSRIDLISKKAYATIKSHQKHIPDDLVESVVLLDHLFSFITSYEEKNSVCNLIEHWWKLDLTGRQKVVMNSLMFLIEQSKTSLLHIKRLYKIKDALELLIDENSLEEVIQLVHQKYMLVNVEGREIIAKLFSFGETWIIAIHGNIKVALENDECSYTKAYAEIYTAAFENATEENRKFITQRCLRDFVFHALRSKRSSSGRDKFSKNLLHVLECFNSVGNSYFKESIYELYNDLVWEHLDSSSIAVRCNAAEVLFVVVSMINDQDDIVSQHHFVNKAYKVITELLLDENDHVCIVAINGVFSIEWENIPDSIIRVWIDGIIRLTKHSENKKLRFEILKGFKLVLTDAMPEKIVQSIVNRLLSSIYVDSIDIKVAFLELLLHLTTETNVKFWNIVPLDCILNGIEDSNGKIFELSSELLTLKMKSNEKMSETVSDVLRFGLINQNGMRRFFMRSKDMNVEMALKLIKEILLTVVREVKKCLKNPSYETNVKTLSVYLFEAAGLLLCNLRQEIRKEDYPKHVTDIENIFSKNADVFCCFIENSSTVESVVLLLSFFPLTEKQHSEKIVESCKNILTKTNISQVKFRIIDLFIKWKKVQLIFNLITEFCSSNVETNRQTGLKILELLLSEHFATHLIRNHCKEVDNFWVQMDFVKNLVENQLITAEGTETGSIERLFQIYVSLIDVLHKSDVQSTSRMLFSLYHWAQSAIVPLIVKSKDPEFVKFPTAILKSIFKVSKTVISLDKIAPKLCNDLILLYCKCLISPVGIVFFNDALVAVLTLLKYYQTIYKDDAMKDDTVSSLLVASMIALVQSNEDDLLRHTNDLRTLEKFFQELLSLFEDSSNCKFMSIIFNTSVSCLGKELKRQLKTGFPLEHIKRNGFPYVTKRILSLIFDGNQLQELCLSTLENLILNYKDVDELSILLILQNRLENDGCLQRKIEHLFLKNSTKRSDDDSDETLKRLIQEVQANFAQTRD